MIIYSALLKPGGGFRSDVILVALLLLVPPVVQLIGGHSARDPLAQVGARKEGRTIVAYELGSLLAVVATLVHAGAVSFAQLQAWREAHYPIVASLAGLLASIALIYCSQAIIGLSSYLIKLAGLELLGGAVGTYSGPSLGLFRLMQALPLGCFRCYHYAGYHVTGPGPQLGARAEEIPKVVVYQILPLGAVALVLAAGGFLLAGPKAAE